MNKKPLFLLMVGATLIIIPYFVNMTKPSSALEPAISKSFSKQPVSTFWQNQETLKKLEATIESRPLFSRTRRPDSKPVIDTKMMIRSQLPLRLAGILIHDEVRQAYLVMAKDRVIRVGIADSVASWTVASISPDSVVLKSIIGQTILKPSNQEPGEAQDIVPQSLKTRPEPRGVYRRLPFLSRMEHHEQDDEQVSP